MEALAEPETKRHRKEETDDDELSEMDNFIMNEHEDDDGQDEDDLRRAEERLHRQMRNDRQAGASGLDESAREIPAGIIDEIYCEHFMCHKKMSIKPCRRVTFITGANGSGKSAILAALQICLGASAKSTHRGNRIGDLVREGHEGEALVRVTIVNEGLDGVHQGKYGSKISIERRFARKGSATLRLLDEHGKYVSKDKKELRQILDSLKITVDNPVCVLDQENAKNFIRGKARDKYTFFLKATEIKGVLSSIKKTSNNAEITLFDAEKQKAKLKRFAVAFEEAKREYEEITKLQKLDSEILRLKFVGAWVTVAAAEAAEAKVREHFAEKEREADEARAEFERLQTEYETRQNAFGTGDGPEAEVTRLKESLDECVVSSRRANEAIKEQQAKIRKKTEILMRAQRATESVRRDAALSRSQLEQLRRENARKQAQHDSSQAARQIVGLDEQLAQLDVEKRDADVALAQAEATLADLPRRKAEARSAAADAISGARAARADVSAAEEHVRRLKAVCSRPAGAEVHSSAFGLAPMGLQDARQLSRFSSRPPVGPIGAFVKFDCTPQERRTWDLALEQCIGKVLNSWVVDTHADKNVLLSMDRSLQVIIQPPRTRYKIAQPKNQLCVVDLLKIDDDRVFNALVDQCQIEATCLYHNKDDAERRGLVFTGDKAKFVDGVQRMLLPSGDETGERHGNLFYRRNPFASGHRGGQRSTRTALLGDVRQDDNKYYEAQLAEAQAAFEDARTRFERVTAETGHAQRTAEHVERAEAAAQRACERAQATVRELEHRTRTLRRTKGELEASRDYAEHATELEDTSPLESDIQENERLLEVAVADEHNANDAVQREKEALVPLESTKRQHEERNHAIEAEMNEAAKRLAELVQEGKAATNNLSKANLHANKLREKLVQHQAAVEEEAKRVANLVEKALVVSHKLMPDFDGRRPTDLTVEGKRYKTTQQVKGRIETLQNAKTKALQRSNVAEIDPAVAKEKMDRAAAAYEEKMAGCKQIEQEGIDLQIDARARLKRLQRIRTHICRRSTCYFDDILNNKGASGALIFDHKQKTLALCYQKDSADASTQIDNVTSLSGGERSFSTLAMLLALGATIECPFRVMDEFDVFMDQVSRRIALRELIEMANQHQNRQFIFITPHDLSSLQPSNILRVFKLHPPIRGQQTLVDAFANAI